MHFMNPVPLMPLVEVVRGLETSDETRARWGRGRGDGEDGGRGNDFPGFISNRILVPMINEAVYA